MTTARARRALLLAPVAALALAGCSFSVGGTSVDQEELEQTISDKLAEQVGTTPDDISCPGDLDAEEGTTMTCVLTHEGTSYDVTITVTGVEGTDVDFDIQVADEPS